MGKRETFREADRCTNITIWWISANINRLEMTSVNRTYLIGNLHWSKICWRQDYIGKESTYDDQPIRIICVNSTCGLLCCSLPVCWVDPSAPGLRDVTKNATLQKQLDIENWHCYDSLARNVSDMVLYLLKNSQMRRNFYSYKICCSGT